MLHLCSEGRGGLGEFASSTATNQYAPHTVIEPKHLDIKVWFDDLRAETAKFSVTVTLVYSGHAAIPVKNRSTLVLNAEGFENVNVKGVDHDVVFNYDGHAIQLYWPKPFDVGDTRKVTIDYLLDHPTAGLYFQKSGQIIGADPCYAASDNESERARYWIPTVDFPTVRTTLTWSITAPEQYTSLANGTLLSDEVENGFRTTKWELDFPCPSYLFCFAVGDLIEVDAGQVEGRPIKYYAAKSYSAEDVKRLLGKTPEIMRWLQGKVGVKLPWTKYYQVVLPPYGGAMENISLVTWTDRCLQDEIFALEFETIGDTVNVHEMAHSYFGDMLVIRHFEHAWLKESWASYFEACWLEDNHSEDAYRYDMISNANRYFEECAVYMRPIVTRKYDASWDMFDAHLYPGGCWRIHMLRKLLGDDAFWEGVKLYVETFTAKTVQTSDFQGCLEKVSGLNLTRFFDEWIYSKGFPKLSGTYNYQVDENGLAITIKQTQVSDEIPLFAFDLEVELVDDSGNIYSKTLTFDRDSTVSTWIQLKNGCAPYIFRVDPDAKILFQLDMPFDQKVLVNTAEKAKDINNRIRAYAELIKKGTRSALKSVRELIANEPFYGVRVQVAKALADAKSAFALEILGEILTREQDYQALAPILNACNVKDENVRKAVKGFLARPAPLPYRAHAAALVALAAQRNKEDLDFLFKTAKDDKLIGQHGMVRAGALKALGYTRDPEALKYLISRLIGQAEPMRSRAQAVYGLSHSAAWQEEPLRNQAIELLESLLQDPVKDIRFAAVAGLVSLRVTSAHSKIASSISLYSNDDKPWVRRKLNKLASFSSRSEEQVKKEQIEKLEEKVKNLEEQLQRLLERQNASS